MDTAVAYHASHEQFAPSHLLRLVQQAEDAGFDAIHSSDHFHPWSRHQGHSGFTFSWIGAAMQATGLPFSMVCAPGQRYHPAIVAQAIATLGEMFEGRFSIELGSGEALNEHITGEPWPSKEVRNQRLGECVQVIRKLLAGEEVTYNGLVHISEAKLYSLPKVIPPLFCAAMSHPTAEWSGTWADGLLTTAGSKEDIQQKKELFTRKAGAQKPVYIQYSFSYGKTKEEAIAGGLQQWKANLIGDQAADRYTTAQFDEAADKVSDAEVKDRIEVITSMEQLFEKIKEYNGLGIERVILHNINHNHEEFIQAFAGYRARQ